MRLGLRILVSLLTVGAVVAQAQQRPKIMGIAHVAYASHEIDASRAFYRDWLGLEEVNAWMSEGKLAFTFFKINDRQFVELTPEKGAGTDRFGDVSFETNDAEAMRRYLAAKGVVVPKEVTQGRIGNVAFKIVDPAGHQVEFVQYMPQGKTVQDFGKHLGPERISTHMTHTGLIVTDLDPEYRFYTQVLGFTETWRGSSDGKVLSWINLKMPDSTDYVEFMLYKDAPEPTKRGGAHHICLVVPSVPEAVAKLKTRPYAATYKHPLEDDHVGKNRKRQSNLFDADGTRTELMEPTTIDGTVTPPSTAPWPPK
ncbi:VOC family protein [Terriglobus sp. TAA 43]|uniref:VOC family protein n=1 Tax=Terriglobus sp. TAA 43 TaxID=278961 RepID=UPI000648692F|nr:VOC family protein [Terriglobus sp. TAA 43]